MLYQTVNEFDFVRAFEDAGRANGFSRLALRVLFEWYDDLSDGTGEGIELDPIGICCEWAEYTISELVSEYGRLLDPADLEEGEDYEDALLEFLSDNGCLLEVDHIAADTTYLFSE
jgi:hypothetical protein